MKENDFDKYIRDLMGEAEESVSPDVWKGIEARLDQAARFGDNRRTNPSGRDPAGRGDRPHHRTGFPPAGPHGLDSGHAGRSGNGFGFETGFGTGDRRGRRRNRGGIPAETGRRHRPGEPAGILFRR